MTDSKNDDNLQNEEDDDNEENKKDDGKFSCYNYDDNTMHTMYLKNSKIDKVKIDKVTDYYGLFVSMLKTEPEYLHTKEHLWVMGIDEDNYSVCLYIVIVGYPNFFNVAPTRLFNTSVYRVDGSVAKFCKNNNWAK